MSTWEKKNRARVLHSKPLERDPVAPTEIGLTWHETLESIHGAFCAGWADGDDVVWGGETPDGEEATFTTEQMLTGIRQQGMWGFEVGGMVHLWANPEHIESPDFAHLVAHEIAHAACGHSGTMEDELEAERYGAVAAQTVRFVGLIQDAVTTAWLDGLGGET